jgi:hypothetical protein
MSNGGTLDIDSQSSPRKEGKAKWKIGTERPGGEGKLLKGIFEKKVTK